MQLWHPRQTWYYGSLLPQDGREALLPSPPFDTMNYLDTYIPEGEELFVFMSGLEMPLEGAKIRGQKSMEVEVG